MVFDGRRGVEAGGAAVADIVGDFSRVRYGGLDDVDMEVYLLGFCDKLSISELEQSQTLKACTQAATLAQFQRRRNCHPC